jgi:hypothetical protein
VHPTGSVTEKVPPIKVLLSGDDGEQATFTRWDGSFVFRDVSPGRYVVDIPSETYLFSQVGERQPRAMTTKHNALTRLLCSLQFKLDVAEDGLIRALEYKYPGAPKARADYPLMAESLTTINYFEQREKFNLLGLLMNPSFLTIIVPIGLLYILPKLSAGMGAWCCRLDRPSRPCKLTMCVLCRP